LLEPSNGVDVTSLPTQDPCLSSEGLRCEWRVQVRGSSGKVVDGSLRRGVRLLKVAVTGQEPGIRQLLDRTAEDGSLLKRRTSRLGLTEVNQLLAVQAEARCPEDVSPDDGSRSMCLATLDPSAVSHASRRSVSFSLSSRMSAMDSYMIEWCRDICFRRFTIWSAGAGWLRKATQTSRIGCSARPISSRPVKSSSSVPEVYPQGCPARCPTTP
jgi:hypothetical protein